MTLSYRRAEDVVVRQTNADLRMLFNREKGVMYELNETASAVLGCLGDESKTVEEIAAELVEEFNAEVDDIREDVGRLLADFADAGLMVAEERE